MATCTDGPPVSGESVASADAAAAAAARAIPSSTTSTLKGTLGVRPLLPRRAPLPLPLQLPVDPPFLPACPSRPAQPPGAHAPVVVIVSTLPGASPRPLDLICPSTLPPQKKRAARTIVRPAPQSPVVWGCQLAM